MSTGIYEPHADESFRDTVATIDKDGKRVWLYPKQPKGKFYNIRNWVSYGLLALLFSGPFIRIGGEPLLMLHVIERKFVIFGQIFWPQDSYLFALGFITIVVSIILFTVVYGRVFCGWICPQTIFMEMVFRKIEYAIEGDWVAQKKLAAAPWNSQKIIKKTAKHVIFYALSFFIANIFLAYIIGSDELINIITDPPQEHIAGLSIITIFSGVFYLVFAKLREQVCTSICPYGRYQGVLLDRDSIVVAYDHVRGENRGAFRKKEDRASLGLGDCVDCRQCVHVCPTGIDIRNGTQLECVNCTACIDACDDVMIKIGQPTGLIRYASESQIADGKPFKLATRAKAYTVVLSLLLIAVTVLLFTRSDIDSTLLRAQGTLYQKQDDGRLSNLYNLKIINKTSNDIPVDLKLENIQGEIKLVGEGHLQLTKEGVAERALFIVLDKSVLTGMKTSLDIGIYSNGQKIKTISTTFVGPAK
jgi:cytochrome c oxidase accessory protein FixG